MAEFVASYNYGGSSCCLTISADSYDDAEERLQALALSILSGVTVIEGELVERIDATDEDEAWALATGAIN